MTLHLHENRFRITGFILVFMFMLLQVAEVKAQKYWRGSNSNQTGTDWGTPANWSPVGVPGPNDDVIIGDAGFTGVVTNNSNNNPDIAPGSVITIKSLTVGVAQAGQLLIGASDFTVTGDVTVGANGELENHGSTAYYGGHFIVETGGVYKETGYSRNPGWAWGNTTSKIWPYSEFLGTGKTIKFPDGAMGFSYLKVSGSVKMLSAMTLITAKRVRKHKTQADVVMSTDNPKMYVSGTFDPMEHKVSFNADPTFIVEQSGTIFVKTQYFTGNYSIFPTYLDPLGTINYARYTGVPTALGNQYILPSKSYGILRVSGDGVKTLLSATSTDSTSVMSNLLVDAGTLDIGGRRLNRTTGGGTMNVANNAMLRLSGANNFPANFATIDLGSTSTVEYYGANQTVTDVPKGYGHIHLTGTGIKTMPIPTPVAPALTAPMIVAGNFTGSGSATFTARSDINIAGNVSLSGTASFNGGVGFMHIVGGNWTNNADFTGNGSTVKFTGTGKFISREATSLITANTKNEFYNLEIAGLGTVIKAPSQSLTVKGDLSTTGAGTLSQNTEAGGSGSLIMDGGDPTITGSTKAIIGNNIILNDFFANGATVTTTSFTVKGNFTVNAGKSFLATGGTITMFGDGSKNIVNNAATPVSLTFFGLRIDNTTLTNSSFYIDSDLSGNNLTATISGTIEFRGAIATFAGIHNLFNVVVSGANRRMVTNSNMGVAGTLTVAPLGFLNVEANIPNTITYNGTIAQTVANITYHHLVFEKSGNKLANNNLRVNGDITIKNLSNFNGGNNFTHTIYGNWINSGTYTSGNGTSTVAFAGPSNTTITGATIFNDLKIVKDNISNFVSLNEADIITNNIYLTTGFLKTGANRVIVLVNRYHTGWIEGTITRRLSSFNAGTSYLFNGPYVAISFGTITSPVTEISVTSNPTIVTFPGAVPVNRLYKVETNGSYIKARIQLQYEDSELNGNKEGGSADQGDEDGLKISYSNQSTSGWTSGRKMVNGNDYTLNWVADDGIETLTPNGYTDLNKYWVISDKPNRFSWDGNVNQFWKKGGNWLKLHEDGVTWVRTSLIPSSSDIAELGREFEKSATY